jgi:hypothetical protein
MEPSGDAKEEKDGKKIQTLELGQYLPIRTTYSEKLSFT